jgi:hypothetical protein
MGRSVYTDIKPNGILCWWIGGGMVEPIMFLYLLTYVPVDTQPRYRSAAETAKKALIIQSGAQDEFKKTITNAKKQVRQDTLYAFSIGAALYTAGKNKEAKFRLPNGFNAGVSEKGVTLGYNLRW